MIIDFHTHIFPDKIADMAVAKLRADANSKNFVSGKYDDLVSSMRKNDIDMSIVLPVVTNPMKASNMNQVAAKTNERTRETGVFSFGGIHPETPNYKEVLNEVKALGLKGIKFHPDYYKIPFNDIRMKRIISYATELGLIMVTHAGKDIGLYPPVYCTPENVLDVWYDVKPKKLVLAHMGGWQLWNEVKEKLSDRDEFKDLYIDTAFSIGNIDWVNKSKPKDFIMLSERRFVGMIEAFGSDRVLFATDSPWADQGEYAMLINSLPISAEDKENIFHKNAEKLLFD